MSDPSLLCEFRALETVQKSFRIPDQPRFWLSTHAQVCFTSLLPTNGQACDGDTPTLSRAKANRGPEETRFTPGQPILTDALCGLMAAHCRVTTSGNSD